MSKHSIRGVILSVMVVSWMLVLVSGVFMFFKMWSPVIKFCHEVGGFILFICVAVHMMGNYKALSALTNGKFSAKVMAVILLVCIVGMGVSAYLMPSRKGRGAPAETVTTSPADTSTAGNSSGSTPPTGAPTGSGQTQ